MSQIIDRRFNSKNKSAVNRRRFIERYKQQIKEAVSKAVSQRSIEQIESGEKISIPAKDIHEPSIHHDKGGINERILPGNIEFVKGDKIKREQQDPGESGSRASDRGEGNDDFVFDLTREEFLDLYFDDLALPDLIKKEFAELTNYKSVRAGFTTEGTPSNIHIVRSMRQAAARRIATQGFYKKQLDNLNAELASLKNNATTDKSKQKNLAAEIARIEKRMSHIPFIDDFDIRYSHRVRQPAPTTKAVMFCLMDVSGSMDEAKKEIAKRFFILLYLFLTRTYKKIDIVFIRHHTSAKEVNEEEFFYSRETGGTVVSSALLLMKQIIEARYPMQEWNIYGAEASDGDNWNADSPYCYDILANSIMKYVQYFAYVEIMPRHHQSLWEAYLKVKQEHPEFAMQSIEAISEIYPVFHELFKRQVT